MLRQDDEVNQRLWVAAILKIRNTRQAGSASLGPKLDLLNPISGRMMALPQRPGVGM